MPRSYGALIRTLSPLPRVWREAVLRALGSEVPTQATTADRAAYEGRMAGLYEPLEP